ncbi:MAG TPA: alpha/beta hydrolase, partial [Nocardioidaceae bacterium]|nr:alpha/beta hydrolase [Nocardioidaceae bacterium]
MTELAYAEWGEGAPLVLLHAFPFSRQMWQFQFDGLTTQMRLVTPDLPGFGQTPVSKDQPALGVMAEGVLGVLDELGLDRVVLGGLSMGGYVAMEILRRRPQAVGALILADTKASADSEDAAGNRRRMADLLEKQGSNRVLAHEVLPTLVGETTRQEHPETVAWLREIVEDADPLGAAWAQRAMAARGDSFQTLRRVEVPTLVIVGEQDELSPPADARAMVEAVPGAQIAVIAGAGHLTAAETPDEFNGLVCDFVLEHT